MGEQRGINFGCRLNAFEANVARRSDTLAGLADAIVVNTCAVTAEAERQARQAMRRARRDNPEATIVVTGCSAQIAPERWATMAEVDRVLGNVEKLATSSYAAAAPSLLVGDIATSRIGAPAKLPAGFGGRARAVVEVQNGCNHRCTFCVIPLGRGPSRSVPAGAVVDQVRRAVAAGFNEIVLSGVDITAWGADLPGQPSFGGLVRRLLAAVPELPRLRLSSLDPAEIDEAMLRAIAEEPSLMPHLHLSLQACNDMVLKRMKRRHDRAGALAMIARARALRHDAAFGADLINGFTTESEEMFADTLAFVAEDGLAWPHVFPYSARPDTTAARMPQLPRASVKKRATLLRAAGDVARGRFLAGEAGALREVLVDDRQMARTPQFATVVLDRPDYPGSLVAVRITDHDGDKLYGAVQERQAA
ncbi:MAG: tRNA (N(6)-L-threonylcarbamoyladenosine(37)-C(2))-methylthiotransferase MtaB [Alphaproteobacteria bacterium]|nr:tRNA (N(6)-L-threonylcarbamoyladenosine(37)-C(2))-methylthiotransferase MtaB [Alphaproteobacteria bacterium]